ncbi:hypothetical protein [Enterobacter phage 01_vB_Eclo_IJM]|nr:hypothetical protein [Enterobacter phage 01_vB_Eclo_IJM]
MHRLAEAEKKIAARGTTTTSSLESRLEESLKRRVKNATKLKARYHRFMFKWWSEEADRLSRILGTALRVCRVEASEPKVHVSLPAD